MNRLRFEGQSAGGFSNNDASGRLPTPLPTPLRLNLGCGRDVRDGFVNIDLYSDDSRVVNMDIRRLNLAENTVDFILASDVLEHFSHRETNAVLLEWARVLKPGGELELRCPSLRLQCKAYMAGIWNADIASYMIFGGQTNPGDYHCIGFDEQSISSHLAGAGFEVTEFEETDTPQNRGFVNLNMKVKAKKKDIPILPVNKNNSIQKSNSEIVAADNPAVHIVWEGSQFVHHSFALVNREHCFNAIRSGVAEVTIVPYENDAFSPDGNSKLEILSQHDIRNKSTSNNSHKKTPYIWIRHTWPPKSEPPKGAKWIIMQPWEFTVHRKDFIEIFQQADEIWTPSNYSRKSFLQSGISPEKVQIVPNGIDPQLFTPFGDKQEIAPGLIKFLFVGGTIYRKGIDILLRAFVKTFSSSDPVCLIIKDMGGDSFYKGQTAKQTIEELQRQPNAPKIFYTDQELSPDQIAELYRSCDIFVSPYRGEGFSLPTLEAMACGLPVVVTDGGATDDFVDDSVGWKISSESKSIGNSLSNCELTGEAFLLEPDEDSLSEILRYAAEHPSEAYQKGIAGMLRARTQWTWNKASIKMFSRIDALYENMNLAAAAEPVLCDRIDASIVFAQAEQELQLGNKDEAISLYNAAFVLQGLPTNYVVTALHRLAVLSMEDEDWPLAAEFLEKAEFYAKDNLDTLYISSLLKASQELWVEALEGYNRIMDDWKTNVSTMRLGLQLDTILCSTGRALFAVDALEEAHEIYGQALKINPNNGMACLGVGLCFIEMGAEKEAIEMLDWAVKLQPELQNYIQETIVQLQGRGIDPIP